MAPSSGLGGKPPEAPVIPPSDLVSSLPAPVTRLLVLFARPIAFLRISVEVLSWKAGRRVESWMVVAAWWGICLGSRHAFKYLLPIAVFLPLLPIERLRLPHLSQNTKTSLQPRSFASSSNQPFNHEALLRTLSDLHAIQALLPASPSPYIIDTYSRFSNLGHLRLARGLAIIWGTWVVLGRYILGFRALLALLGTIALLLPSPSFAQALHLLSKSLLARRALALAFLLTFGSPPEQSIRFDLSFSVRDWVKGKWAASRRPSLAISFRPKVDPVAKAGADDSAIDDGEEEVEKAGEPIYFRFELHENQRWWMGLDWTSALLPQERPSWCDLHLLPVSPPPSFPLPPSSSIVLPSPTATDAGSQIKRTATWKWLDDDWSIVRAGPGQLANTSPAIPSSNTVPVSSIGEKDTEGYAVGSSPPRVSTSQLGTSPTDDLLSAGARAHSIAEQAFTRGLEKLKARTTASGSVTKQATGSPRASNDAKRIGKDGVAGDAVESDDHLSAAPAASTGAGGSGMARAGSGSGGMNVYTGGETICERDEATDADGWVYGDNKWENMGPKGGLGRFTRRRRWQRRAVCSETIQRIRSLSPLPLAASSSGSTSSIPAAPLVANPTHPATSGLPTLKAQPSVSTDPRPAMTSSLSSSGGKYSSSIRSLSPHDERRRSSSTERDRRSSDDRGDRDSVVTMPIPGGGGSQGPRDDVLRQRLKKAMGNVGG